MRHCLFHGKQRRVQKGVNLAGFPRRHLAQPQLLQLASCFVIVFPVEISEDTISLAVGVETGKRVVWSKSRPPECAKRLRNIMFAAVSKSIVSQAARSRGVGGSSRLLSNRTFASLEFERVEHSDGSHFLLILGKPGGGKGTISGKVLKDMPNFHHLSSGDVLRHHVRDGTDIGKEAKTYMDSGALVPDELMVRLIMEDAHEIIDDGKSLLLDGFPRTLEQAAALDQALDVDLVINLDIPTETIVERISDRWIHAPSGRVYSYSYKPPQVEGKDDVTGEPLTQRDDDKPDAVRKRLATYDAVTAPLVDFYNRKGVLKTFQGTMSDVIYPEVKGWLDDKLHAEE